MAVYTRYCPQCLDWYPGDSEAIGKCPRCGLFVRLIRCNRCGHEWRPRRGRYPITCPMCKSPYYNKVRKKG